MSLTRKGTLKAKRSSPMLEEYRFDYARAKPNRFAGFFSLKSKLPTDSELTKAMEVLEALKASLPKRAVRRGPMAVVLDPDVARAFDTGESVNAVLRALLTTVPPRSRSSTLRRLSHR